MRLEECLNIISINWKFTIALLYIFDPKMNWPPLYTQCYIILFIIYHTTRTHYIASLDDTALEYDWCSWNEFRSMRLKTKNSTLFIDYPRPAHINSYSHSHIQTLSVFSTIFKIFDLMMSIGMHEFISV